MKLRYILNTVLLAGIVLGNASCSKKFLEVEPHGTTLESNYYTTPDQVFAGLVAAYDPLGTEAGGTYANKICPLNCASDDCYAGGGSSSDMSTWQAWNNYTLDAASGPQSEFWSRNYTGIYRCNVLLSKLGNIGFLPAANKSRYIAEVKTLRAYYYFELVRLFGNIPLIIAPIPADQIFTQKQSKPDAVYAQIEKDLKEAKPDLPAVVPAAENGRVTKGVAAALLGKVVLFQNNNGRMLEAAGYLEEVNTMPNYQLLKDYGAIFSPDNKFNSESIFEVVHTSVANGSWGNWPNFEGNVAVQMMGPRAYTGPTYASGWGFNPVTLDLVNALKGDPRYPYTVANIDSITKANGLTYEKSYQNTGYFVQKYAPMLKWRSTGGGNVELNYPNDVIEIRLADTYLMEAEALLRGNGDMVKAQSYFDKVRARVGLTPLPLTLDNIMAERRLELATEGHRWFDLIRTGKAATVLSGKGFKPGKNEVLPIPLAELNNTALVQNTGY